MTLTTLSEEYIKYLLSKERAPGIHTIGYCSQGCGKSARGGGVCEQCLLKELEKRKAKQ